MDAPRPPRAAQPVYPISLIGLTGAPVVVVGGGVVAARKVAGLLPVGAAITVIAPEIGAAIAEQVAAGRVVWRAAAYAPGDLTGARLAFAATNQRAVNAQVCADAASLGILCNVADDPHAGDFHVPAVHRTDEVVIAVSSHGQSPRRATALRDRLAAWLAGLGNDA